MGLMIKEPVALTPNHEIDQFHSGVFELNNCLKKRALKAEGRSSRTYVISRGRSVIGYYCLSAGSISRGEVQGKLKRNMPDPIPVMVLGRLAIDHREQGKGLGAALLKDAILRTLQAADVIGIRAILVHAINRTAQQFYEGRGFRPSLLNNLTLMLSLDEIKRNILS